MQRRAGDKRICTVLVPIDRCGNDEVARIAFSGLGSVRRLDLAAVGLQTERSGSVLKASLGLKISRSCLLDATTVTSVSRRCVAGC